MPRMVASSSDPAALLQSGPGSEQSTDCSCSGEPGCVAVSLSSLSSLSSSSSIQVNIMRDKVALNLPVVMTKRTNKKLAQDNPFFSISVEEEGGLAGECRVCQARAVLTHHTRHTL